MVAYYMGGDSLPLKRVNMLIKRYKTNDPFELSNLLNIIVIEAPLGNIKGCYKHIKRNKVIFINSELDYYSKKVVCAHELGHAVIHPNINCRFMQNYTLYRTDKIELEANKFCAHLLIPSISEFEGFTYDEISAATYIPVEIVKLRHTQKELK